MSKYLLYAIGEIILVVIGILIALSINNWNQERIARIDESDTLYGLLEDLKANESILVQGQKDIERELRHTGLLLDLMSTEPSEEEIAAVDSLLPKGTEVSEIHLQMGGIESIIASKLGLITSDSLQQGIMRYPTVLEGFKVQERLMRKITEDKLRPRVQEFICLLSMDRKQKVFSNDRKGLLSDRKFSNHLVDRKWESGEWLQRLTALKKENIDLITAIETHLANHSK